MRNLFLPIGLAMLCSLAFFESADGTQKNTDRLTSPVGKAFQIKLPSLSTSGYEWHLVSYDKKLVAFKEKHLEELPENAPLGRSAAEIFVFQGLKPGSSRIAFAQYRSWEGPEKASNKHEVEVKIEP
ncbi:MAG TPA: hypothetical protein DD435_05860 [Cyanobacteria bacterium UBA8530]|nr:hypothetical protein [Cyanobacteria bacterium UBA8530]